MWNPFKKAPAPQEVPAPGPSPKFILPGVLPLKALKWVVVEDAVGIVTELDSSGYASVMLVDGEGCNLHSVRVHGGNLRIAKYLEIPEVRRPADPLYAATLGYM